MVVGDTIVLNPGCAVDYGASTLMCLSNRHFKDVSKCSLKLRRIIRVKCLSALTSSVLCKIKVASSKDLYEKASILAL